jgi:hypothetical protein
MSKAQKGNKENKKPKADKNQSNANVSAYKAALSFLNLMCRGRSSPQAQQTSSIPTRYYLSRPV